MTTRLVILALLIFGNSLYAQEDVCKVLLPNISGTYTGDCKKGLAHGKGVAQGIDYYEGQFVKGLPSGKGTYKWQDGSYYEGQWANGLREGKGRMVIKDSVTVGFWKKDKYAGEKLIPPYIITRSMNIVRSNITESGSAVPGVKILIVETSTDSKSIEGFTLSYSSGSEYRSGKAYGIQNPTFPLDVKIRYTFWNNMHTAQAEAIFEFTINDAGAWDVSISN